MGWPDAIVTCVGIATAGAIVWKFLDALVGPTARDDEEEQ